MVKKKSDNSPDFSFKEIESQVDELFDKKKDQDKYESIGNISDKIKEGMEIKNNLPEKGFMEVKADEKKDENGKKYVEITYKDTEDKEHKIKHKGIFCLDLRNDAEFWFIRTPILVPQIYKQAIRTHLDIKKCHEPERRKIELPIALIIGLIIGTVIIILSFISLLMK